MTTRTAAERRAEARADHRARAAQCPANRVMQRIGDKWVGVVFKALASGPLRHGELARAVPGADQKVLTETLRRLERDGLLARTVHPGVPPRVDYALTDLGSGLLPLFAGISQWADTHIADIESAQAAYDSTATQ